MSKTGLKGAKALVLLSSGLDSTINSYQAKAKLGFVAAVTFDYGQRAAKKEIERSKALSKKLKVPHLVIDIKWLGKLGGSSLTDKKKIVPQASKVKIDDLKTSHVTAKSVWVPNRNGVFLNIVASIAEANAIPLIIPGFNVEEAQTFPDNSKAFISALNESFVFSTNNKVKVECFTTDLNKTEIVKLGRSLNVDFKLVWPCYFAHAIPCGQCESCLRFKRAMG